MVQRSSVEWLDTTTCSATESSSAPFIALLNEHQIFNVSLRALDGAEIQSADLEAVGSSIAHGIVQHLTVGGRVTDNAVFAHLFAASLKLRLDRQTPIASGVVMACATGKI